MYGKEKERTEENEGRNWERLVEKNRWTQSRGQDTVEKGLRVMN
jgi:hypothetical protein